MTYHRQWILALLMLCLTQYATGQDLENILAHHASPYLAMHGQDPVAWQEWNNETVARAKKENRLLFVSSGYFSCHWCHVMQRESYRNTEIAAFLNQHFIPVKVDRELDGALDSKLIDFVEKTQGIAGWPLNVFITPEGYPLVGMVYVTPDNFKDILRKLDQQWQSDSRGLAKLARDSAVAMAPISKVVTAETRVSHAELLKMFTRSALDAADEMAGGFGDGNKFPSVPQLQALLLSYKVSHDSKLEQFLVLTLDKMYSQGLWDQLGGGFFRYAVDPGWQIPHFEKMLYDNALLADLYMQAAEILNKKEYDEAARQTLDFMISHLQDRQGGMQASLSAIDSHGVEGGYYLWQEAELSRLFTKRNYQLVRAYWGIKNHPELEAGHHLVRGDSVQTIAQDNALSSSMVEAIINKARQQLLAERDRRKLPADTKKLAGWNGLALTAMAHAAARYKEVKYQQAMLAIRNYILMNLWKDEELYRAVENSGFRMKAELEDYAYVAQGLEQSLEVVPEKRAEQALDKMIERARLKFYGKSGWKLKEQALLRYGEYDAVVMDGTLPSASSVLLHVAAFRSQKTGNQQLRKFVAARLRGTERDIHEQPFWYASQIRAMYLYYNAT